MTNINTFNDITHDFNGISLPKMWAAWLVWNSTRRTIEKKSRVSFIIFANQRFCCKKLLNKNSHAQPMRVLLRWLCGEGRYHKFTKEMRWWCSVSWKQRSFRMRKYFQCFKSCREKTKVYKVLFSFISKLKYASRRGRKKRMSIYERKTNSKAEHIRMRTNEWRH